MHSENTGRFLKRESPRTCLRYLSDNRIRHYALCVRNGHDKRQRKFYVSVHTVSKWPEIQRLSALPHLEELLLQVPADAAMKEHNIQHSARTVAWRNCGSETHGAAAYN